MTVKMAAELSRGACSAGALVTITITITITIVDPQREHTMVSSQGLGGSGKCKD